MRSILAILKESKTIAVVGLSNRPERASHAVAAYLQRQGYRILGVNPSYAGQHILGVPVYASLAQAAAALDGPIDVVDCFRSADAMLALAREAIDAGARCLWMQLGVVNQEAADLAAAAGLDVVMDRCMKIEHAHAGAAA
ncbi:CoA-binding protein [Massilia sp. CCM 8695]|uniref:CoA-binding protein n=1 Tax=Massilia frigida TaxID=2609281 RepID=A0ABX0NCA9_9BURK|nr:CoA-binding protein [Massilia frigida]NHZ82752.1 CoA-binding protein [Massilia frigida]